MADYDLHDGDELELVLRLRKEKEGHEADKPVPLDAPRKGLLDGPEISSTIYPTGRPIITLFDLGTRLRILSARPTLPDGSPDYSRSRALDATEKPEFYEEGTYWHEYVEINVDGLADRFDSISPDDLRNVGVEGFQADLPAALQHEMDEKLLGSRARRVDDPDWRPADTLDPLGTTKANGSHRPLAHCMPLAYRLWDGEDEEYTGSIPVDVVLLGASSARRLVCSNSPRAETGKIGQPFGDPPNLDPEFWKERAAKEKDALEHWNPINVAEGNAFSSGYLDTRHIKGRYNLRIESRLYYEPFDTSDAENYKVTREPYYEADAVESFAGFDVSKTIRIYLKPQWLVLCPERAWSTALRFAYQTQFFDFSPSGAPFTRVSRSYGNPTDNVGDTIFINISGSYDPDIKWGDYAAEANLTDSSHAALTVTGPNSWSGIYEAITDFYGLPYFDGRMIPTIAGLGVGIVSIGRPDAGHAERHFSTAWNNAAASLGAGFSLTTATLGRLPVVGRPQFAGWSSVYDYMGGHSPVPATRAAALAFKDNKGCKLGFRFHTGSQAGKQVFKRRPLWNHQEVARRIPSKWQHRPLSYYALRESHFAECVFTDSPSRAPALIARPFGDHSTLAAEATRMMTMLRACTLGMGWHRERSSDHSTILIDSSGYNNDYTQFLDLIPSWSSPAGTLCGVVVEDKTTYYVWRKIVRETHVPDYEKDNAGGAI